MKDDWWKYPNSFLKLIMNTGETKEVHQEDINSDVFESLVARWHQIGDPDITVALPFPGDYGIDTTFDAGFAWFTITKGTLTSVPRIFLKRIRRRLLRLGMRRASLPTFDGQEQDGVAPAGTAGDKPFFGGNTPSGRPAL